MGETRPIFSAYIIGDTTLALECAETIMKSGHQLLGIVSAQPLVEQWAKQHATNYFRTINAFMEYAKVNRPDYIFSIVNYQILSADVLSVANKFCINFHDALLPKYAGNHSTSWAILNKEREHGITWHVMVEKVDMGNVLKQVAIPLDEGETAHSLNLKCYENAMSTFKDLIDELSLKNYIETEQDAGYRSFYALHKKPPGNALLQTRNEYFDIETYVRALSFGNYVNRLSLPKLICDNVQIIPAKVKRLNSTSSPEGHIYRFDEGGIQIVMKGYDLLIEEGMVIVDHKILPLRDMGIKQLNLENKRVINVDDLLLNIFEQLSESYARFEAYWIDQLSNRKNYMAVGGSDVSGFDDIGYNSICINLGKQARYLNQLSCRNNLSQSETTLALLLVYLSQYNDYQSFSIDFSYPQMMEQMNDLEMFFSSFVPFNVSLNRNSTFDDVVNATVQTLYQIKKNKTFLKCSFLRYPELHKVPMCNSICIQLVNDEKIGERMSDTSHQMIIKINTKNPEVIIHFREGRQQSSSIDFLINPNTVNRVNALLEVITSNKDLKIGDLPLISDLEYQRIVIDWNNTSTRFPGVSCLHDPLKSISKEYGHKQAVVSSTGIITYEELLVRSNRLAAHLKSQGCRPSELIAVIMEKGWEQVVAVVGALMAGSAYLPININEPSLRRKTILEQARVKIILTQDKYKSLFNDAYCVVTIDKENFSESNVVHEDNHQKASDLAYVIFTSGSTGTPKGVMLSHKAAVNTIQDINHRFNVMSEDKILGISALNFDLSVYDIFGSISSGATLILTDEVSNKDPDAWLSIIKEKKITIWNSVPMLMQMLIDHLHSKSEYKNNISDLKNVRLILLSGDWIPVTLPDQIRKFFPQASIISMGGATEAAIWSIMYPIEDVNPSWKSIPYGKPMANQKFYILNEALQYCPIGMTGELYIGGEGIAEGYWDEPTLTKASFILHPKTGERLYKTGDLGRYLDNGNIEFVGRKDLQVKIRGFRIELEEIQAHLNNHPSVQHSVVINTESQQNDQKITAYIIKNEKYISAKIENDSKLYIDQVIQWEKVYDYFYENENIINQEDKINLSGWISSYANTQLPEIEMKDWINNTVNRIKSLQPKAVLEIGCGAGLLLSRIAPGCNEYYGFDISKNAVDYIQNTIINGCNELSHVNVFQAAAHQYDIYEKYKYDFVILNSCIQYFPNIKYLVEVLTNIINQMKEKGCIFVGDVRNLTLLNTFCASIELANADNDLSINQLKYLIGNRCDNEKELNISPDLFFALQKKLPKISHVEVCHKEGYYDNEMTRFRYDVIIYINGKEPQKLQRIIDWQLEKLTMPRLKSIVAENELAPFGIINIPNSRVTKDNSILEIIKNDNRLINVGQLKDAMKRKIEINDVNPGEFYALKHECQYNIEVLVAGSGNYNNFDAVFIPKNNSDEDRRPLFSSCSLNLTSIQDWNEYANQPSYERTTKALYGDLMNYLKERLPDYMLPSALVFIDSIPFSPNGKVDRKQLPLPINNNWFDNINYIAPRNNDERWLTTLWSELLNVESKSIGIHNNFFNMGGNSLLATRAISRINEKFDVNLSIRDLFKNPEINLLYELIKKEKWLFDESFCDSLHIIGEEGEV